MILCCARKEAANKKAAGKARHTKSGERVGAVPIILHSLIAEGDNSTLNILPTFYPFLSEKMFGRARWHRPYAKE